MALVRNAEGQAVEAGKKAGELLRALGAAGRPVAAKLDGKAIDLESVVTCEGVLEPIFAESEEAGVYLAVSPDCRQVYVTGHPEYDADTLHNEYQRDTNAGINPQMPKNYYRNDDPNQPPRATWRSHGHLLFANWLNYYVYQNTPFDLGNLG